ncbi:MAG TPA: rod shape-determining protein MreD [Kofleriaceae bacterium]|nr:rod shape-determining protein MreD [Kofleriaceae bacterium]
MSLIVRLVLLGIVAVLVQITAISQISLLGVSADLTPLIVASVGLLAGSIPGAIMGFGMGLFVDTALVQTLGVDSLLLTGIGYGAGRLHEVRDPSHTLVPIAVGAAATAISQIGFSLIQFLLGVDAPVSWLLLREILFTIAVNTVIALPVYALVRRLVAGALPEDPRRRRARRAASVTGGLSPLSQSASPRRRRRGLRAT